ncbi:MAG: DUF427 domain-containing protein [Bacteroidota bacterium]
MKAIWNGKVLVESKDTKVVEGNHHFPPSSEKKDFFSESNTHTDCPWKRKASYYHIEVNGEKNPDAAWYYPEPPEITKQIKDYVAFWKGVKMEE